MYVNLRSSRPTCGSEVIVTAISRIWPRSLCPRRLRSKSERAEASGIAAVPTARSLTCGFGTRPNGLPHDRQRERGFTARSSNPSNPPLTSAYALRGAFPGRHRPLCVRACRGRGRRNGRTGTDGEGRSDARDPCTSRMPTILRHRLPADLPIQAAGSLAPQVVEPTADRASCTHSAASPPPAASISSIICTGTMYSPICSARWRGQGRVVTFL